MRNCTDCGQLLPLDSFARSSRSADGLRRSCKDCQNEKRAARRDESRRVIRDSLATLSGKVCPRCDAFKNWDEYHVCRSARDGKQPYCKDCGREIQREYKQRHAEVVALRQVEKLASARTTGTKACTKCGETKPILSFYYHRNTKDGRATYCKECQKAASRAWTAANSARVRARNAARDPADGRRRSREWWYRAYGISEKIYHEMVAQQNGACAICLMPERYVDARTGQPRNLAIDHNHETGKVRGLLCGRCNRSIGQFADDHERLTRAAAYLRAAAIE